MPRPQSLLLKNLITQLIQFIILDQTGEDTNIRQTVDSYTPGQSEADFDKSYIDFKVAVNTEFKNYVGKVEAEARAKYE